MALIAVKPVEISTDRGRQREYWVSDMQPHHVLKEMHNIFMKIVLSAERTPSTIEGLHCQIHLQDATVHFVSYYN